MSNETELSTIGQIAVTVSDVSAASAFYRDTLGLRFLFNAGLAARPTNAPRGSPPKCLTTSFGSGSCAIRTAP